MKIIYAFGRMLYGFFYAIFSLVRYLLQGIWKILYGFFYAIFFLIKWAFKIIYFIIKAFLYLFGVPWKTTASHAPIEQPTPPEHAVVFPEAKAIVKVGTIVPVEEDHGLRTFTILNAEGEIFKINTALPGPFYGPNWTRVLSCYETKETVMARLVKPTYGQQGRIIGYQVRIGKIKAFLPISQAIRPTTERPINIRVSIIQINPTERKVLVSAKQAYYTIFGKKPLPKASEETDAIFWDYDDEFLYFLLPGEYVGQASYQEEPSVVSPWMGKITRCRIESIQSQEQRAIVSLISTPQAMDPVASLPSEPDQFPLPGEDEIPSLSKREE